MKHRIIVLGADYVGTLAAVRTAKLAGSQVEVVLISSRSTLVDRVRLHEEAMHDRLPGWPLKDLLRGTRVVLRTARVLEIDPARHTVVLNRGELRYDKLIFADESTVGGTPIPGAEKHAFRFDAETASELGSRLRSLFCRLVTVCDSGLAGVELAGAIAEAMPDRRVTLLASGSLAPLLGSSGRAKLKGMLRQAGVTVIEKARVERIERDRAMTEDPVPHHLCIVVPQRRASPVANRSGFLVNVRGQVMADRFLRALGYSDVYVAGEAAWIAPPEDNRNAPGWEHGMLMGARAASNAVASLKGSHEQAFDCQDYHLAVSIGRRRALVQPRGSEFVLTGPLACAATALIKRSPLWSIRLERFGWYDHLRLHRYGRRLGTQGDGRRTDLSDINDHVGSLHRRH